MQASVCGRNTFRLISQSRSILSQRFLSYSSSSFIKSPTSRRSWALFSAPLPIGPQTQQPGVRYLNLHEYQSQDLMQKYGINVPRHAVALTVEEAHNAAKKLFDEKEASDVVIKAQVLAGGRGRGVFDSGFRGGVHVCHSLEEVDHMAPQMLGHRLITKQTNANGAPCNALLIAERVYNRRELYVAFIMDREAQGVALIVSLQGGVEIEQVAKDDPAAIMKVPIDANTGLSDESALDTARRLLFDSNAEQVAKQFQKMYNFFVQYDCTQFEINPFVETPSGEVLCLDAKVNFDRSAEFRHKELFKLADNSEEDPREVIAQKYDLSYVGLHGNVGCLVNGAGLAMATMDVIKLKGGEPANFLDVGGSATEEQVYQALKIMSEDSSVQAILVNIFGGIMRCDIIAKGLISAVEKLDFRKPIVVRLKGTNQPIAVKLIEEARLRIVPAEDLDDAAKKAVNIANITQLAKSININVNFEL
eukprot:c19015_g2_i2.p1 GENE.c19015_g2_i2~~c19015_g2_i2.p1  ORF type:complete len:494 (+),score=215.34 c19015_g2_i2:55-1482(+)